MTALFRSTRLHFAPFTMDDAQDVYACITPDVTRFMRWDPPASFDEFRARREKALKAEQQPDRSFVVRHGETGDCLGMAAVEGTASPIPELGLWLKAEVHGRGYGFEVVDAIAAWASCILECQSFDYPVAIQNVASRRIAERLGGREIGRRTHAKYDSVVYRIPASRKPGRIVLLDG